MHIAGSNALTPRPLPGDPPFQEAGRAEADVDEMGVWSMFWPFKRGPAMLFHEETVLPRRVIARQHQPIGVRHGPEGAAHHIEDLNPR